MMRRPYATDWCKIRHQFVICFSLWIDLEPGTDGWHRFDETWTCTDQKDWLGRRCAGEVWKSLLDVSQEVKIVFSGKRLHHPIVFGMISSNKLDAKVRLVAIFCKSKCQAHQIERHFERYEFTPEKSLPSFACLVMALTMLTHTTVCFARTIEEQGRVLWHKPGFQLT